MDDKWIQRELAKAEEEIRLLNTIKEMKQTGWAGLLLYTKKKEATDFMEIYQTIVNEMFDKSRKTHLKKKQIEE